ncbi:alpha/beta fold hydrolase [Corynebacterium frankenforstense]|uniref:alpha/beta hydrolase n=1 Tax=Corynebacterium TaxID=1716 RepID=UPI00254A5BC9|nr:MULTISPECIES: alpha/beta fold hydrolase [Corynebacterium]MDK6259792.1 alpha/beta fold hydrolase [Corynebacterium frankenforstense]MDK8894262.1 alpha/beta fold hydrolase [Corynebacterium sp. MSK006]
MRSVTEPKVLKAATTLLLGCTALGTGYAAFQNSRHARPYNGYEVIETRSSTGNIIHDAYHPAKSAGSPLFVIIPGLSSSVSSVAGLGDALASLGGAVLLHNRAGYGGSQVFNEKPFHMGECVEDLNAVIRDIRESHDTSWSGICLVGHSYGGFVAHEFARQNESLVHSVGYIDPLHPKELVDSEAQKQGSDAVALALRTIPPFIRFGVAALYRKQAIEYAREYKYFSRIRADLFSSDVWTASKREWSSIHPFLLEGHALEPLRDGIRTKLFAAQETVDAESSQDNLYHEYSNDVVVVKESNHQTILTGRKAAKEISEGLWELATR